MHSNNVSKANRCDAISGGSAPERVRDYLSGVSAGGRRLESWQIDRNQNCGVLALVADVMLHPQHQISIKRSWESGMELFDSFVVLILDRLL